MKGSRAAVRYARAVMAMAEENEVLKAVNKDMILIEDTIEANSDLRIFLKSPVIKNSIKGNALEEIFSSVNGITKGLFNILLENGRIGILVQVASNYQELYNEMHGIQLATVTTAFPLTPELEGRMLEKVRKLTGKEAKLQNVIDENIIGGFVLRVGDVEYNASVRSQLNELSRELHNNTYISKLN